MSSAYMRAWKSRISGHMETVENQYVGPFWGGFLQVRTSQKYRHFGVSSKYLEFTHLTYSSSSFSIYPTGSQYVTGYDYHTSCLPMNPITKVIISPHPQHDVPSSSKDAVFCSLVLIVFHTPILQSRRSSTVPNETR